VSLPFADPVIWHVAGEPAEDDSGNHIPTYTDQNLCGVTVWPNGSSENIAPQDVATGSLSVDVEGWPAVKSTDELTVWGDRYAITGWPQRYHSPLTGMKRTALQLLRRT
jgi:hypothetical protein